MQRNAYKGDPPRPWIRLRLVGPDGRTQDSDFIADTANPLPISVGLEVMDEFRHRYGPGVQSNFGLLEGGLIHVAVPELGFEKEIIGFAGDSVADAARTSSPDFQGVLGLPLLRIFEYGGDADWFWIRRPAAQVESLVDE